MAALVQVCLEADYNAETQTCASPYFAPQGSGLPSLTLEQANEIGAAIALLWAVAWCIRRMMKTLDQS
jgi:hypothetical protein